MTVGCSAGWGLEGKRWTDNFIVWPPRASSTDMITQSSHQTTQTRSRHPERVGQGTGHVVACYLGAEGLSSFSPVPLS